MEYSKEVKIPFSTIVDIVKNLSDELKDELFEKVFIDYDISPLNEKEKKLLREGMDDFEKGDTVTWKPGE